MEVDGLHPVMVVLLQVITEYCQQDFMDKKDKENSFSLPQTGLMKQKLVPGPELQKNRFCDLLA